jgi:tetratricopeptide (TPR) repeat protein
MGAGMKISDQDEKILATAIARGEGVLVLGAGASASSLNRRGEPVKQASALSRALTERAGLTYSNESLWEVLSAIKGGILSASQIELMLSEEYLDVIPSQELRELFKYTWKRVYTWNIDDSINNVRGKIQRAKYFNGLIDKARDHEPITVLHVVNLHGEISKPEHGLVLTEQEYNERIMSDRNDWYRRAAQDYASYVPIFIGSRLNEPILSLELDRARRSPGEGLGRAFLVSPDNLSDLQVEALKSKQIVHLKGTLKDFSNWISLKFPNGVGPRQAAAEANEFTGVVDSKISITEEDLDTARSIFPISFPKIKASVDSQNNIEREKMARVFLRGNPPTWEIAAADVPVWLENTTALFGAMSAAISRRDRLFLVYGQSGSGKSTAIMQSLLKYQKENPKAIIYDFRNDIRSVKAALSLITRLHDDPVIIYVGDAFLYGDSLYEDLTAIPVGRITVISGARTGEWREHLERRLGDLCDPFEYQRFVRKDFGPLIEKLLQFVPSPRFRRMDQAQRIEKMARSKSQLLIALREATESQNFADIITDEYQRLPRDDSRILLLIVGMSTIARVGIPTGVAREAYNNLRLDLSFEDALPALDGIVNVQENGRMYGRHELYVRHLVENVVELDVVIDVIIEILRTFTKYEVPIVKNVERPEALLFKFLLNHNFVRDISKRRGRAADGLRVYSEFEVDFQLDGHYWLQYGQYLKEVGRIEDALVVLQNSIRAYPNNAYALHAYAEVQLSVARRRAQYDAVAVQLIGDAVKTLLELDSKNEHEWDQYPIVTLAEGHVGVLHKHGQADLAKKAARNYFERVVFLEKRIPIQALQRSKEKLAHFISFGDFPENAYRNRDGRRRK